MFCEEKLCSRGSLDWSKNWEITVTSDRAVTVQLGVRKQIKIHKSKLFYVAVGASNTVIGFGLYTILLEFLGPSNYLAVFALAHILATVVAFVLNRKFVFRSKANWTKELIRFFAVNFSSAAINFLLLIALVNVMALNPLIAQAIASAILVFLTYLLHLRFTFRSESQ